MCSSTRVRSTSALSRSSTTSHNPLESRNANAGVYALSSEMYNLNLSTSLENTSVSTRSRRVTSAVAPVDRHVTASSRINSPSRCRSIRHRCKKSPEKTWGMDERGARVREEGHLTHHTRKTYRRQRGRHLSPVRGNAQAVNFDGHPSPVSVIKRAQTEHGFGQRAVSDRRIVQKRYRLSMPLMTARIMQWRSFNARCSAPNNRPRPNPLVC